MISPTASHLQTSPSPSKWRRQPAHTPLARAPFTTSSERERERGNKKTIMAQQHVQTSFTVRENKAKTVKLGVCVLKERAVRKERKDLFFEWPLTKSRPRVCTGRSKTKLPWREVLPASAVLDGTFSNLHVLLDFLLSFPPSPSSPSLFFQMAEVLFTVLPFLFLFLSFPLSFLSHQLSFCVSCIIDC